MTLTTWRDIVDATTRKAAFVGDSTTERGFARAFRGTAQARFGYGGLGFRHMGKTTTVDLPAVDEWTQSGTWTKGATTDVWTIGPCNGGLGDNVGTWHGSGATAIWMWTKPKDCPPITSFDFYVCDATGANDVSQRIDGGAWTALTGTWTHANGLRKLTVNTAVTSTIEIRAANSAGVAADLYMVGGEPHCSATGIKVHEIAAGGQFSSQVVRTGGVPDWTAWFQLEQPQVCTFLFINDTSFWGGTNPDGYQQRVDDFCAMVRGYGGEPIIITYFGWGTIADATQLDKRARELAVAQKYDCDWIDLYTLGGGAWPAAAQYLEASDTIHPNTLGMRFMANHVWNHLGKKLYADKLVRS